MLITVILGACKKPAANTVDPRITANYIFKPGTYWIYKDGGAGDVDSQYVVSNGTQNGMPYMEINEILNGHHRATIYIGAGPAGDQLQLWGYDFLNLGLTLGQTIFQVDPPAIGTTVSQGLVYAGTNLNTSYPYGVTGNTIDYTVLYSQSNKNNEYGDVDYFFYPNLGIVEKDEYGTSRGDLFWVLNYAHIVQ